MRVPKSQNLYQKAIRSRLEIPRHKHRLRNDENYELNENWFEPIKRGFKTKFAYESFNLQPIITPRSIQKT
jgi:hypothetical protein